MLTEAKPLASCLPTLTQTLAPLASLKKEPRIWVFCVPGSTSVQATHGVLKLAPAKPIEAASEVAPCERVGVLPAWVNTPLTRRVTRICCWLVLLILSEKATQGTGGLLILSLPTNRLGLNAIWLVPPLIG